MFAQATDGRDANCAALRAIAPPGADPVNGDLSGDFSKFIGSSSPAAVAGYVNVTVPAGFIGPLPIGVPRWTARRGADDSRAVVTV